MTNIFDSCSVVAIGSEQHWHAERAKGIGGSDVGAIVGVVSGEYQSPYHLWCLKTGRIEPQGGNEATKWGHRLEATVADAFAEETGMALIEWPGVTFVSHKYPWMRANVDRFIVEPTNGFPAGEVTLWTGTTPPPVPFVGIFEAKTSGVASHGTAHKWWDDDGGETVPDGYLCQGYHYGLVTGLQEVWFGALLPPHGLQVRRLDWDPQVADDLIDIEGDFWMYVEADNPPPLDGTKATTEAIRSQWSRSVAGATFDGGIELARLWEQYQTVREVAERAEREKQAVRNQIVALFQDSEVGLAGDTAICTYKTSKRTRFDQDALAKDYPDLIDKYTVSFPVRTLRAAPKQKGK